MTVGVIEQYKGPFGQGYTLNLNGNCKIGISISEDDFMSWKARKEGDKWVGQDFIFYINDQSIHMGRSYMYETDTQINNTKITFPQGAPLSTIVDITYCEELKDQE